MFVKEGLLRKEKKYIIGVSGGPDSMALLDYLVKRNYNLIVALVNYHIRSDSDLDALVVSEYCVKNHLLYQEKNIHTYQKGNFEAQARDIRYRFFQELAQIYQCEGVILAHHKDDFLETVLMQKGRGMKDVVYGMAEVSQYGELAIYRPLMGCYKEELVQYCEEYQVPYRIDSTNLESYYTRNYYRNEVLSHYSLEMKEALYAQTNNENELYYQNQRSYEKWLSEHLIKQKLSLSKLLAHPQKEALFKYYLRSIPGMNLHKVSETLVSSCLKALEKERPNMKIDLPVNFVLIKEYDNIYVTKLEEKFVYHYQILDATPKDYGYFKIASEGNDREGVPLDESDFPLTIRTRQKGDVIELSYGKKKLSRLFIDAKIPAKERDVWPVVLNSKQEIILVPKIAKNKRYLLAKPVLFVIQ